METKNLSRKIKAKKLFDEWRSKAEPFLIEILEKNKDKMVGLEFMTNVPGCSFAYTSGANINKILVDDDRNYILEERDSTYSDSRFASKRHYSAELLAWTILEGLQSMYEQFPYNQRRNKLVRNIEKRVGINLKKVK